MSEIKYGVYVKLGDGGVVTEINSDAHLADLTGWTKIDEGAGDRFRHAQGNYLPEPVRDVYGRCQWRVRGGVPERMDEGELGPLPQPAADPMAQRQAALEADVLTAMEAIAELYEAMIGGV